MRTDSLNVPSQHWSDWVAGLRLEYSVRKNSASPIDASDCSSWPTASVANAGGNGYQRDKGEKGRERLTLVGEARRWGTPIAHERATTPRDVDSGIQLANQANKWPTPLVADDGDKCSPANQREGLIQAVRSWPTPRQEDGESAGMRHSRGVADTLTAVTATWPTPMTRDHRSIYAGEETMEKNSRPLSEAASLFGLPDQPTHDGPPSSRERRTLNPRFVEWLMGWPIGWTASEPVAMASCLWLQRMRGALWTLLSAPSSSEQPSLFD
jgi:hypothetical protein